MLEVCVFANGFDPRLMFPPEDWGAVPVAPTTPQVGTWLLVVILEVGFGVHWCVTDAFAGCKAEEQRKRHMNRLCD